MVAVIDYRAGNLTSVKLAFDTLGQPVTITNSPAVIETADRVVFPGVGAAGAAMAALRELRLVEAIRSAVQRGTPFLGICIGYQIALAHSDEDGGVQGIGLLAGNVRRFQPTDPFDKVPQMGWNSVRQVTRHPLFKDIPDNSEFYFVHSYYPAPSDSSAVVGVTEYAGTRFASMVGRGNLAATQFHPEKSGRFGLKLLENFLRWEPKPAAA
jgi:glutamine amidotransferase